MDPVANLGEGHGVGSLWCFGTGLMDLGKNREIPVISAHFHPFRPFGVRGDPSTSGRTDEG